MLEIHLSQHFERLSEQNPFGEGITGPLFLEHQRQTADVVPTYPLTINTYPAGTGKTLASLLGWLSLVFAEVPRYLICCLLPRRMS